MVAVSDKQETRREARASGRVIMQQTTLARIAGISAVKRTADLIPLCHPLRITGVKLDFVPQPEKPDLQTPDLQPGECEILISATVTAMDRTGVEMEALTAVAVAGLTIYDMCKAIDRGMRITDISLDEKSGGRSGHYVKPRL